MKSYLQLLNEKSAETNVSLLKAFKCADIPTSTYYRTIYHQTELRFDTAEKVMKAFEKLHALQQARAYTQQLRDAGERPHIRSVRFRFKPRSTSS
jgi:predicted transcriptional regulator